MPQPDDAAVEEAATQAHLDALEIIEANAEVASSAAFAAAVISTSKDGLDRARGSAETVQKSATAIFALYTGALTLAFSVTDQPLPARGALPGLFLGAAIALAAGYVAFLVRGDVTPWPAEADTTSDRDLQRATTFAEWVNEQILRRARWLRAAVVALVLGVASLPLPFLTLPEFVVTAQVCADGTDVDPLSGACLPAWPSPSPGSGLDIELEKALLGAELTETAAARERARVEQDRTPNDLVLVAVLGIVGLAVILLASGARIPERRNRPPVDSRRTTSAHSR